MKNPRTNIYGAIFIAFLAVSIKPDLYKLKKKNNIYDVTTFSTMVHNLSILAGISICTNYGP